MNKKILLFLIALLNIGNSIECVSDKIDFYQEQLNKVNTLRKKHNLLGHYVLGRDIQGYNTKSLSENS